MCWHHWMTCWEAWHPLLGLQLPNTMFFLHNCSSLHSFNKRLYIFSVHILGKFMKWPFLQSPVVYYWWNSQMAQTGLQSSVSHHHIPVTMVIATLTHSVALCDEQLLQKLNLMKEILVLARLLKNSVIV